MSDRNLRLQVILNAVDKITRPFKTMQASNKALAAAVKNSRDELKRLSAAGDQVNTFNSLQTSIKKTADELAGAKLKAQMMTREMGALENPTKKQTKALEDQWRAVDRLEQRQKSEVAQMGRVRSELYRMGVSATDGTGATNRIANETARYNRLLQEQERQLKRAGEQQRRMNDAKAQYDKTRELRNNIAGTGAATIASGVAMGAPVLAAVKSYSSIEDAMKGVAKQVNPLLDDNGKRTAKYHEMQQAIKVASEQLPMENGAADFAALVEGGARMGVSSDKDPWQKQKADLLSFAATSAKAAKAFELPADQLADDLGKIAFLYHVPTQRIEELGDALNYLDDNAQSKGADIINVLQRMGDVADKLNYKQAAALASTFLSLGTQPEVAASASKAMVRELGIASMQGKRFIQGMSLLGLNAKDLEKGIATNAIGTIRDVLSRIKKLPASQHLSAMTMLFGKEFGDDAAKLANNIGELDRQLALVEGGKAKGSMQRESNIDKDSLSSQFLLLKTTAKNMFSDLGEPLRKPLMDVNDWFKRGIGWARKFIEAHPKLAAAFVKTAAVVALVTVALGGMMIGVAAILGPFALLRFSLTMLGIKGPSVMGMLARSIKGVGTAIIWVGRMMLANPILAVAAAIAAAALYIWMNWDTLGPKIKKLWDNISAYTSEKWQAIKDYISGVWTSISAKASETWEEIKRAASSAAEKIGIGLKRGLDVITAPLRAVMDGFKWLLEKLDLLPQKNEALAQTNELLKNNPIAQKYGSVGEPAPTGYTANDMAIRFTGSSMKPVKAPSGGNFYYQPKIDLSVDARNNQNGKAVATDAVKALREHMQKDAARARSNFSDRDLGWEL
ncbi:TPA: phage tail tape measure protein [Serratia marcescens]|nr:phage tail tape measure protein [Serratia marcescens]CUY05445.1 Phage-related minor tail protein [Serratia marcescens]CUY64079.1 Phage-related minor tail protein [Serratia marcescens]CUY69770.1 Phage-related minor tail protein [Serratia marcescens]CUY98925.1 Phage-related minor tail protein [Serratia marcescens]CVA48758.1 Phage-related minor tail protein [Serratia marcescens]